MSLEDSEAPLTRLQERFPVQVWQIALNLMALIHSLGQTQELLHRLIGIEYPTRFQGHHHPILNRVKQNFKEGSLTRQSLNNRLQILLREPIKVPERPVQKPRSPFRPVS